MKFSELIRTARPGDATLEPTSSDPEITGVALDSRLVQPGFVFCAAPGIPLAGRAPLDGHDFIAGALERGAVAVVGSRALKIGVPYLRTANPRAACALLSGAFWGRPQDALTVVGITGSKGKSTTVALVSHLLEAGGLSTGRMSTIGIRFAGRDEHMPGHFTTPEAPQVYELLHRFKVAGCTHAVLEVSSHALELERVAGIRYQVGVWVNFFPDDHIDFHGSEEAYFAAKRKLLERSDFGVLNAAEKYYPQAPLEHWSFGAAHSDWRALETREDSSGLHLRVASPLGEFSASVPMIGAFNALNVLAALATCARFGVGVDALRAGLETFPGVPGRMQVIQTQPFRVINDFAHTGASLEAALGTLRGTTPGRLIVVVGAAGQRDPARRTGIGAACAHGADVTLFTEEDHRTESLETILAEMRGAYLEAGGRADRLETIPNRTEAIDRAVQMAKPGDTVLLAGKGHERTLERGDVALPWDETAVARGALAKLG
jgi:UDP-N-acetylmuramoyl-L-alanyl-D-glutamate--2,6-diaminopimelate ligase